MKSLLCYVMLTLMLGIAFAVPTRINYQGKLTNPTGVALDGSYNLNFRIYNALGGGLLLWSEAHSGPSAVVVTKGLFDVILGEFNPITLAFDIPYWLEIQVGAETLTPRTAMTSVGYAFRAAMTDSTAAVTWSDITGIPAGFADGIDDVGGGVTSVTASAPLNSSGGATPNISLTGIVPVANGGTGLSTITSNALLVGNTTNPLNLLSPSVGYLYWNGGAYSWSAGAGGDNLGNHTATQDLNMNEFNLINSNFVNFGATSGFGGYGFRDSSGTIQYKNSGGNWSGFPDPPPLGTETEWWYRPAASAYIRPLSNPNVRVYDSLQVYGFYYNGNSNTWGGYFRSSASGGGAALRAMSDYSGLQTDAYMGYVGNITIDVTTVGGAGVWGDVTDTNRIAVLGRTPSAANFAAIVGYSGCWIGGYFKTTLDDPLYSAPCGAYGEAQHSGIGVKGYAGAPSSYFSCGGLFSGYDYGAFGYCMDTTTAGTGFYYGATYTGVLGVNITEAVPAPAGDYYHFGVHGAFWEDNNGRARRSGGVLGDVEDDASLLGWGSLGYHASNGTEYGGYFTTSTTGAGLLRSTPGNEMQTGIGFGGYGGLMGGWVRGDVYGLNIKGNRYALYIDGETYTNAPIAQLTQTRSDKRIVSYVPTSMSVDVYAKGIGRVINGVGKVRFNKDFSELISNESPVVVTVTPMGQTNGVYLASTDNEGFVVVENNNGHSNTDFSWIAIGTKKDYENPQAPSELISANYDENMNAVMFNEANTNASGLPIWWNGYELRFDEPQRQATGIIKTKSKRQAVYSPLDIKR